MAPWTMTSKTSAHVSDFRFHEERLTVDSNRDSSTFSLDLRLAWACTSQMEKSRGVVVEANLGGGSQELVNEVHVADHVVLIGDESEEGDELLSFLGLQLLTERGEDVEDLSKGDLASAVLVEDLQALNVILLAAGGGGVGLGGGQDGEEVGESNALLAQLGSASSGHDGSVGHVAAQSAEDVADVEGVDIIALVSLVEDDESILGLSFRHFG